MRVCECGRVYIIILVYSGSSATYIRFETAAFVQMVDYRRCSRCDRLAKYFGRPVYGGGLCCCCLEMDEVAMSRKSTRAKLQGRLLHSTLTSVLEAGSVWDRVADMLTCSVDDVCRKHRMMAARVLWTRLLLGVRPHAQYGLGNDFDLHAFLQLYSVNISHHNPFWVFYMSYTIAQGRLLNVIISWIGIDLPVTLAGILKGRPEVQ